MNYKPLPESVTIKSSPIHGLGLFAVKDIPKNTDLGMMHLVLENMYNIKKREIIRTPVGGHVNHSEDPNCEAYKDLELVKLKSIKDIKQSEELTTNYWLYKI